MAGIRAREHGALEAEVMRILRACGTAVGTREIQRQFSDPRPAYTTLLTTLERLRVKGMVTRLEDSPRKVRFAPAESGEEHASSQMLSALQEAEDRRAVLLRFAGNLDEEDVSFLRRALGSKGTTK